MSPECVVLVHGLWMNGLDMTLLAHRLREAGFDTRLHSYNTLFTSPRESADALAALVAQIDNPVIHFVGHSLGGLVIRHYFHDFPTQKPGRVVTLGTPHKGSYSAWRVSQLPGGQWLLGDSVQDGLLGNVPAWPGTHDLGSIAGNLRFGLGILIPGLPRPNDGTVSVEETRLEKMRDHTVVHATHFGLLFSTRATEQSIAFLREGRFHSI